MAYCAMKGLLVGKCAGLNCASMPKDVQKRGGCGFVKNADCVSRLNFSSIKSARPFKYGRASKSYPSITNMDASNDGKKFNFLSPRFLLKKINDSVRLLNLGISTDSTSKSNDSIVTKSASSTDVTAIVLNEVEDSEITKVDQNLYEKREWNFTRLAVWGSIIFTFYFLRSFLGIIFGTMVISMLSLSMVSWAEKKFSIQRRVCVASLYLLFLSLAVAYFVKIFPSVLQESTLIMNNLQTDKPYVVLIDSLRRIFGESFANQLDDLVFAFVKVAAKVPSDVAAAGELNSSDLMQAMFQKYGGKIISFVLKSLSFLMKFIIQTSLSLLFSFLIVWDFPELKKGVQTLKDSKIKVFYDEIAPVAASFGVTFHRGLKAQATIAVVNSILTAGGILALEISPVVQLTIFVFVCSFVPIAGVFVSTIPIAIIALADSGFIKLSLVILMVVLIHAVEAYILNPTIYSAHLSLHPIMALAVLFIAEHNLGVWGLLLAVPVASFLIDTFVWGQTMSNSPQPNHG